MVHSENLDGDLHFPMLLTFPGLFHLTKMVNTGNHPYPKRRNNPCISNINAEISRYFGQLTNTQNKSGHQALLYTIENSKPVQSHVNNTSHLSEGPHPSMSTSNASSLQPSLKISQAILNDITHWRLKFSTLKLRDNVMEAFSSIFDKLLDDSPDLNEEVFMCDSCYGQFSSEEEHYDLVLRSYVENLTNMPVHDESESVFEFLRKKLRTIATNDRKRIFPNYVIQTHELIRIQIERVQQLLNDGTKDEAATVGLALLHYLEDLQDKKFVLNSVCKLIIVFFEEDQETIEQSFKMVLKCLSEQFSEADQIHDFFRKQFLRAAESDSNLESYKHAFAALHYVDLAALPDSPGEFLDLIKSKRILRNHLNESADTENFDLLSQVLVQIIREGFRSILQEFLAAKSDHELIGNQKAVFLLIRGTLLKMSKWENIPEALSYFQNVIMSCSECPANTRKDIISAVAAQLITAESQFHAGIVEHLWREIRNVRNYLGDLFLVAPTILPELKITEMFQLKSWDGQEIPTQIRFTQQKEEIFLTKFTTNFDKALAYFDLFGKLESTQQLSCILIAIAHLLQAMKESEDVPTIYAYFKIIQMYCGPFLHSLRKSLGPHTHIYFQRFAVSALVRSSLILRGKLKEMPNDEIDDRRIIYEDIVSRTTEACFANALNEICYLATVYPLITVPIHSLTDYTLRHEFESSFLSNFLQLKRLGENHRSYLPKHLYSYQEFESHWSGWGDPDVFGTFEECRFRCMKDLLNSRNWNISHVQKILNTSPIRINEQGWMDNENHALNLDNVDERQVFASCLGLRIDTKSGQMDVLVDYGDTNSQKLFTSTDIREVMNYNVGQAFLTLGNPDSKISVNPFQEFQFWPPSLSKSKYISTMLHVDYFLQQLLTGTELSGNSPFESRPISEGILKRLPEYLRRDLKPILERIKDPIHPYSENAHPFWIEITSVETATSDEEDAQLYEFGSVELSVKTERSPEITDSAEQEFAEFFTQNYDAIGTYFPILLRLKELAKISAAQRILASRLEYQKNQIASLEKYLGVGDIDPVIKDYIENIKKEVKSGLEAFLKSNKWDPPHPIYSPTKVEYRFQQILRERNLTGKESRMSYTERQSLRNAITTELKELDNARFQFCANKLAKRYGLDGTKDLCIFIRGWFDQEEMSTKHLENICCKGKCQKKLRKLNRSVFTTEAKGVKDAEASDRKFTSGVDCNWIPSPIYSRCKPSAKFEDETLAQKSPKTVQFQPEIRRDLKPQGTTYDEIQPRLKPKTESEIQIASKPEVKPEIQSRAEPESKPEATSKTELEIQSGINPRGTPDSTPAGIKPETKSEAKSEIKMEIQTGEKPECNPENKPQFPALIIPEGKPEIKPEFNYEIQAGTESTAKPKIKPEILPDVKIQTGVKPEVKFEFNPENKEKARPEEIQLLPESALYVEKIDTKKKSKLGKLWSRLKFMIMGPKNSTKIPRETSNTAMKDYVNEILSKRVPTNSKYMNSESVAVTSTLSEDETLKVCPVEPFHIPIISMSKCEDSVRCAKPTKAPTGIDPSKIIGGIAILADVNLETFTRPTVFRPKRVVLKLKSEFTGVAKSKGETEGDHNTTDVSQKSKSVKLEKKFYPRRTLHSNSKVMVTLHRNNKSIPRQSSEAMS